jgi:hypothetical protein
LSSLDLPRALIWPSVFFKFMPLTRLFHQTRPSTLFRRSATRLGVDVDDDAAADGPAKDAAGHVSRFCKPNDGHHGFKLCDV